MPPLGCWSDGSNLLHALTRGSGTGAAPPAAVVGRLRGVVPASVAIDLVFDGPSERGLRGERIASGMTVRYSGPRTGDAVILSLVDEVAVAGGASAAAAILVVTDDRDLRHALRMRGARTAGCAWLIGRLDRPSRNVVCVRRERATATPGPGGICSGQGRRRRGPSRMADWSRRHDEARQPAQGAEGLRWATEPDWILTPASSTPC